MKNKDNHRTIKLDGDVSSIADELASKRQLSKVLSELLRKEYGISFEDDLLKSKLNDLKRQNEIINEQMEELNFTIQRKNEKAENDKSIESLEIELNNLGLTLKKKMNLIIEMDQNDLGIDETQFEPHELMSEISKAKGKMRLDLNNEIKERHLEIIKELEWRYDERENYE
jgi:hypothetical protein